MLSLENPQITIAADAIRTDDERAASAGEALAEVLALKSDRDHPGRYHTAWGSKTPAGLARTVVRLLEDYGK